MNTLGGIPIVLCPWMPDDEMYLAGDARRDVVRIFVGTKEPDEIKLAGRQARLAVRHGLRDILDWLGEPIENEPVLTYLKGAA